jgi:hypothetical protein
MLRKTRHGQMSYWDPMREVSKTADDVLVGAADESRTAAPHSGLSVDVQHVLGAGLFRDIAVGEG